MSKERLAKALKYDSLDGRGRAALTRFYSTHPVEWINDWCWTLDPRETKSRALMPFVLFPRQVELLNFIHQARLDGEDRDTYPSGVAATVEKSRDTGVSWCAIAYSVHQWLHVPYAQIGFGSYKASKVDSVGSPDSLLEKARILIRNLPRTMRPASLELRTGKHLLENKLLNPDNKAVIFGESGDEIGRGSRATVYFVDEAAFLERPHKAAGALANTSFASLFISTPNGPGYFWRQVQNESYRHFKFSWRDDPRKSQAYYDAYRAKWGPVITSRELDMDHSGSVENLVLDPRWVEAARNLNLTATGAGIMGLDIADGGENSTTAVVRYGSRVEPRIFVRREGDTTQTAKWALEIARTAGASVMYYETNGVGAGVASAFRHLPKAEKALYSPVEAEPPVKVDPIAALVNKAVRGTDTGPTHAVSGHVRTVGYNTGGHPSTHVVWADGQRSVQKFATLRAEMWWTLRERLRKTYEHVSGEARHDPIDLLSLPDNDQLCRELASPTWFVGANGKIGIESKKQMKQRGIHSPDLADALVLTFAPPPPTASEGQLKG